MVFRTYQMFTLLETKNHSAEISIHIIVAVFYLNKSTFICGIHHLPYKHPPYEQLDTKICMPVLEVGTL